VSPRVEAAVQRTFASVRSSRNFRLYLAGMGISAMGTWMNFTASSWLVLQLTGSGTVLGVNSALMFGPVLFLGPFGGVLADRFDKRRILLVTQFAYALVALTLSALVFTDVITIWMVYTLSVISGCITAIDNPSRQSFYVEMVGEDVLTNAVSLNSAVFTGSRIVGPAFAGILIATVGMAVCFLIDGLSYFAVLAALFAMRPGELHEQRRTTRDRGHLMAGLRYAWETPELRRPLLVMAVVFTLVFQWQVLVPLLAERTFDSGPREFGIMSAAAGVGSFVAALWTANRNRTPSMRRLSWYAVGSGVSMALVAVAPTLFLATVAMIPMGFSAMSFMINGNTMMQLTSRPEARGRVMALYGVIFLGSTPIGAPIIGWIGEHLGPRIDFLISAAIALGVGGGVMWARRRAAATAAAEPEPAGIAAA
jgi:MFS family permease